MIHKSIRTKMLVCGGVRNGVDSDANHLATKNASMVALTSVATGGGDVLIDAREETWIGLEETMRKRKRKRRNI